MDEKITVSIIKADLGSVAGPIRPHPDTLKKAEDARAGAKARGLLVDAFSTMELPPVLGACRRIPITPFETPVLSAVEGPVLSAVEGPVLSAVEGPALSAVEGPALSAVEGLRGNGKVQGNQGQHRSC